jgi:hypothetical protein
MQIARPGQFAKKGGMKEYPAGIQTNNSCNLAIFAPLSLRKNSRCATAVMRQFVNHEEEKRARRKSIMAIFLQITSTNSSY